MLRGDWGIWKDRAFFLGGESQARTARFRSNPFEVLSTVFSRVSGIDGDEI